MCTVAVTLGSADVHEEDERFVSHWSRLEPGAAARMGETEPGWPNSKNAPSLGVVDGACSLPSPFRSLTLGRV